MAARRLGRLVRQYNTDIRARRMRVILSVCVGILWGTAATMLILIAQAESNLYLAFGAVLYAPGVICLGSGIMRWRRIEGVKRERIELYEQGVVALRNNSSMVVRWSDIYDIGRRAPRPNPLLRISGVDPECTVILKDGRSFWFDSNTSGSEELTDAIMDALRAQRN